MKMNGCLSKYLAAAAFACLAALSSANASIIHFYATLLPEAPGATGTGSVWVGYDDVEHTLQIHADWSGLSGTTTVSHIHCCVLVPGAGSVGVAVTPGTLPGFPVGTGTGSYSSPLIDLDLASSFTGSFVTNFGGGSVDGARLALLSAMRSGTAYFNIHTTAFPPGEIRGFLQVPEPGTLALLSLALAGLVVIRRRRA